MSAEQMFDLKLSTGKVVTWPGRDGEDAARRYVDAQRVAGRAVAVVATRPQRHGVFVLGAGRIIG